MWPVAGSLSVLVSPHLEQEKEAEPGAVQEGSVREVSAQAWGQGVASGPGRGRGAGSFAGAAVYDVVDGVVVDDGVAFVDGVLRDGDILIAVLHAYLIPGVQGDVVNAAIVVVGPIGDGLGLARGGVVVGVVGFVDDLVVVGDSGNLAVVADDAVVAAVDGGGAGS